MSQWKTYDYEYLDKIGQDPHFRDPKWLAIEELEQRIGALEKLVFEIGQAQENKAKARQPRPVKEPRPLTHLTPQGHQIEVGSYVARWAEGGAELGITANEAIDWESRPMRWLEKKLDESGFTLGERGMDGFMVFVPRGERWGPVLGLTAWALYTASKEADKNAGAA